MKIIIALLLLVFVPYPLSGQAKPSTDDGESPDVRLAVIALRKACTPDMRTPNCRAANAKGVEARLRQNSPDVKVSVEGADNDILVEVWQAAFDGPATRDPSARKEWEKALCVYDYKRVIVVSPLNMTKYEFELNCSTTPQPPPPTFHGLKLGLTLGSQLNRCRINQNQTVEGKWDELCFRDIDREVYGVPANGATPGAVWWVELLHGLLFDGSENKTTDIIQVLMPAYSKNAADGTIEEVRLEYDIGQTDSILAALKAKYGQQPECEKSTMRTGMGIPVDSLECTWTMPWGSVSFSAPWTKISNMSVSAKTTRFEEHLMEQQRKQSDQRKAEF